MGPEPKTTRQWLSASLFCINRATIKLLAAPPTKRLDKKKKVVYINTTFVGIVGGMLP